MEEKYTPKAGEVVVVPEIPGCDICLMLDEDPRPGVFDCKTIYGPWGHVCEHHVGTYSTHRGRLGVGKGQRWITADQVA